MRPLYEQVDNKKVFKPHQASLIFAIFYGFMAFAFIRILVNEVVYGSLANLTNWSTLFLLCITLGMVFMFLRESGLVEYRLELEGDQLTKLFCVFGKPLYIRQISIRGHYCFFEESYIKNKWGATTDVRLLLRVGPESMHIATVKPDEVEEAKDQLSKVFNG